MKVESRVEVKVQLGLEVKLEMKTELELQLKMSCEAVGTCELSELSGGGRVRGSLRCDEPIRTRLTSEGRHDSRKEGSLNTAVFNALPASSYLGNMNQRGSFLC